MALRIFTRAHVAISLVAIVAGLIVVCGLLAGQSMDGWTLVFLVTTVLTSVTGFGFPFEKFLPSHALGIISLVVLAVALFARYSLHMDGAWRRVYVVGAVLALYLNVFVLIVQAFLKVPTLKSRAPTQSEPSFVLTQMVNLAVFVGVGIAAVIRFHP
jgi:hypothetical protein